MTKSKMDRRDFLRKSTAASGVLMVATGIYGASENTAEAQTGSFDYIICGAGSAGCVLAARLTEDYNGADSEGVNFEQLNTKDGKRLSSAVAFLRHSIERSNLSLLTNSSAKNIELEGSRATGISYIEDGEDRKVTAKREVILSGGTIESPKMLMLFGIGERAQLEEFGIIVKHELPGVGKNLHDHSLAPVIYEGDVSPPSNLSMIPLHPQAFMRSDPRLPAPDTQPLFFQVVLYTADTQEPITPSAYTLCAGGVSPTSRGELRLTGPNLEDPHLLETDNDVQTLVTNIKMMREIAAQPALAEITTQEIYPGPDVQSDEDLADYARNSLQSYHHQVGTCKMGRDEMSVVDHELKVHGIDGQRVIIASIMPVVPTGNTNAHTYMVAEKEPT